MSVTVVTQEDLDLVIKELAQMRLRLEAVEQGGGKGPREYLTPKDVAKRFGVGNDVVYAALDSGRLRAEARPGKGHARVWRIQPDEARAWYEAFIAKRSGQ